jgi:DNA-binding response OmpR family regulator
VNFTTTPAVNLLTRGRREEPVASILCVDDDPEAVATKQFILQSAGHAVTACVSIAQALSELDHRAFDAVVTDWRLGDDVGRPIIERAKSHARVPVIVVSGFVCEAFQAAAPLADLYLEKPVDPNELVSMLDTLLRGRPRNSVPSAR